MRVKQRSSPLVALRGDLSEEHVMSPRRIAIVLPDLRIGGAERISVTLAEELVAQAFAIDMVLLRAEGALLETVPDGARIIALQVPRLRNSIMPLRRFFLDAR